MDKIKHLKIANIPILYFLPLAIIVLFATYDGSLGTDAVGAFAILFVLGGLFFFIGGKLPIIGKWFGGAVLLPLFGGAALVYFHLLPSYVIKSVSNLMSSGFINIYIIAVIVGSIMVMDKKTLLASAWRIIPCIIGTQVFIILFLWLGGLLIRWTPLHSIFMVGLPTYAGGSSGSIVAVPSIYSPIFHHPVGSYSGEFLVFLNINNVLCVFLCSVFNQLGKKFPKWTGNGQLLKGRQSSKTVNQKKAG